jgi:DNA-binding GntR family transcriptional regulator
MEEARARSPRLRRNAPQHADKVPVVVIKKIRDAILEEAFKPGERLPEVELAEAFKVSRSPVREALLALEKEGTVVVAPYKGAMVKPLSPEEALDIAELRLALIALAIKPACHYLSPADFDLASELAKRILRTPSAREFFESNRCFWAIIFEKARRPILYETFRQLDDRATRYNPLLVKLFPTPETRPQHHQALIELCRQGKVVEALRAFRRIYLEATRQVIAHLQKQELVDAS